MHTLALNETLYVEVYLKGKHVNRLVAIKSS